MNRIVKLIIGSLCFLCVHFAYGQNGSRCPPPCPPKECPKPCPKPCPPTPCPKPCPPPKCKPCCPPVCFERGYPDTQCCLPSAYNEPADYELSPCPWDFWIDASFTYWIAYEEGLDIAESTRTGSATPVLFPIATLLQDTEWKPGFKIGLGMDLGHDHWSLFSEYTWFRSRTSTSAVVPPAPTGTAHWNNSSWLVNGGGLLFADEVSSTWRLRMDLLDVGLTRPFYQGTHLIVAPFGGVRAAWIRQNLRIHPTLIASSSFEFPNPNAVFHNKSNSWAVGPRGGFQGEWHLGWGFRIEGDVAGSILFTRYTTILVSNDRINFANGSPTEKRLTNYDTIRFNNDMNIGLGWGDYFDCRNYHFDLLVTYDFQIFWNQNMMRNVKDQSGGLNASPNNLYLQGLTVRAQFDF